MKEESVTCNSCGAENLHWVSFRSRWYLFDENGGRHKCVPLKHDAVSIFKEAEHERNSTDKGHYGISR